MSAYSYISTSLLITFFAYLIFKPQKQNDSVDKPPHIAAFSDIPPEVWTNAIELFKAQKSSNK